jgi:hypothetical protein
MTSQRDAYVRSLQSQLSDARWSVDELRVIQQVVDGLVRGRDIYGPLQLATDHRNWRAEARAEYRDAAIYEACAMLASSDRDLEIPVDPPLRRKTITVPPKASADLTFDLTDLGDVE